MLARCKEKGGGDVQVGFLAVRIKVPGVTDASVSLTQTRVWERRKGGRKGRRKGGRKERISQSAFST